MAPRARSVPLPKNPKLEAALAAAESKRRDAKLVRRIEDAVKRALPLIRKGNYASVAAAATGTPTRTWQEWETRARAGDEPYATAFLPVDEALAVAETKHVEAIVEPKLVEGRADATRIHARQFMLERSRRARWGPRIELRMKLEDEFRDLLTVRLRSKLSAATYEELVRVLTELEDDAEQADGQ